MTDSLQLTLIDGPLRLVQPAGLALLCQM